MKLYGETKEFNSPANRQALEERPDLVALPKKDSHSVADSERENAAAFLKARRKNSAVESAINGLESFGLDLCPVHGFAGFKRYVALGTGAEYPSLRGLYVVWCGRGRRTRLLGQMRGA